MVYPPLLIVILTLLHTGNSDLGIITPQTRPSTVKNKNLTCEEFCAEGRYNKDHEYSSLDNDESNNVDGNFNAGWYKANRKFSYMEESSIIFGLSEIAEESYLSKECYRNLKQINKGVLDRDIWAMKVLDASGQKESGFIWGQNYWLGSQKGCEAVQSPVRITLSKKYKRVMKSGLINDMAPFEMEYRVIYLQHNSPWQVEIKCMTERIIHVGLCLPKVCTSPEVQNITQHFLDQDIYQSGNIYDLNADVIHIKDLKLSESFFNKKSIKIVLGFLTFTLLMIIGSALLNMTTTDSDKKPKEQSSQASSEPQINSNNTSSGPIENEIISTTKNHITVGKFIKCFDVVDNCRSLFTFRESTANSIPVINGLRSISCLWIMLFHVIWYMYFTVDNKTFLISYGERMFFQYVSTAPLLVDVFFTISGFLLTYNFMKNEKNLERIRQCSFTENLKAFGKMILHRYLRLAPLYLVLIGMVEIFTTYAEDVSIFHIHERYDQTCSKHWWRNVIFIQNLFHQDDLCLNWTWSLACEMQFFCLGALLLFFHVKHPQKAKALFATGLISTMLWTYITGMRIKYQLSFDVVYNTGTDVYINPFVRVLPYFIGVGAGWFLATSKGNFDINSILDKCLWNVAIIIFFTCIYSTFKRDMSFASTICLLIVGRTLFSAAVCWMIIGSATGRGCWWSRILECKIFQHLNKLSYAIYLLNPFIIAMVFSLSNSSTNADPILLCVLTSGFVVIVYISSIIFSLAFEIPYCNFSSELLRKKIKTE